MTGDEVASDYFRPYALWSRSAGLLYKAIPHLTEAVLHKVRGDRASARTALQLVRTTLGEWPRFEEHLLELDKLQTRYNLRRHSVDDQERGRQSPARPGRFHEC